MSNSPRFVSVDSEGNLPSAVLAKLPISGGTPIDDGPANEFVLYFENGAA